MRKHIFIILAIAMLSASCGNTQDYSAKTEYTEEQPAEITPQTIAEKIPEPMQENPVPESSATDSVPDSSTEAQTPDAVNIRFLEIGSVNCIPCKMMKPVMEKVGQNYSNVTVLFYDIYSDSGKDIAEQYKVKLIPTQVFLNEDDSIIHRHEGFYPYEDISVFLDEYIKGK